MNDTKQQSVILITHDKDDKDDRASIWLAEQGYRLDWCCPAEGETIPTITDQVAGAVIYGGKYDVGEQKAYPFLVDELKFIDSALETGTPFSAFALVGNCWRMRLAKLSARIPRVMPNMAITISCRPKREGPSSVQARRCCNRIGMAGTARRRAR